MHKPNILIYKPSLKTNSKLGSGYPVIDTLVSQWHCNKLQ